VDLLPYLDGHNDFYDVIITLAASGNLTASRVAMAANNVTDGDPAETQSLIAGAIMRIPRESRFEAIRTIMSEGLALALDEGIF
jgi:hypothetical protein